MKKILFYTLLIFVSVNVSAAQKNQNKTIVTVPKSDFDFSEMHSVTTNKPYSINFATSSWVPNHINYPTFLTDISFYKRSFPYTTLGYTHAPFNFSEFCLSLKGGASFLQLKRSGTQVLAGIKETKFEEMDLIFVNIGSVLSLAFTQNKTFDPYIGVSAIPTLLLIPATSTNTASSDIFVMGGFEFGTFVNIDLVANLFKLQKFSFIFGGVQTLGTFRKNSLNSIGVQGGIRLVLN